MTKGAMREGVLTDEDMRRHEAEVMRFLSDIETLVNEVDQ